LEYYTSTDFWQCLDDLPKPVQALAHKNFALLKENPRHPSLRLKRIDELWSVRVGINHRALGIDVANGRGIQWIWVGSHADYDKLIT
jgi:hypothetical protein